MIDTQPSVLVKPTESAPRLRLHYLDGLRGLAALYVVLYHCYMQVWGGLLLVPLPAVLRFAINLLSFGHLSVDVFIVLSGYCLMIPVACSADRRLSGSMACFFKKRAIRILPPYYLALLIFLLLIWCVPLLRQKSGSNWDEALPAFTPSVILSHLLLIHNFSSQWRFRIDYPMWSVATEWQIYVLFPLLLLPVWRRFGIVSLVLMGFVFWITIHILFHAGFDGACLHFASLFSFGMVGAILGFSTKAQEIAWRNRLPWGTGTIVLLTFLFGLMFYQPNLIEKHTSEIDVLAGLCVLCLLVCCTQHLSQKLPSRPVILVLMESRIAVGLGRFSYSLYLIHAPVIAICYAIFRVGHHGPVVMLACLILIGVPVSLLFSYIFFLVCERPFLQKRAGSPKIPILDIKSEILLGAAE